MATHSCFKSTLLCFLLLIFSNDGFGRKLMDISDHAIAAVSHQVKLREMIGLDYEVTGPNFNGRSALPSLTNPSPPPSPPPPPPSKPGF